MVASTSKKAPSHFSSRRTTINTFQQTLQKLSAWLLAGRAAIHQIEQGARERLMQILLTLTISCKSS